MVNTKYRMSECKARGIIKRIREILQENGIRYVVEETVCDRIEFFDLRIKIKINE